MAKKKYLDEVGLAQVVGTIREQIDDINTEIDNLTVGSVECDTELSDTSEKPVQNKVIKAAIDDVTADLANYLLKTGGLINSDTHTPLEILSTSSGTLNLLKFYKGSTGTVYGLLGFDGADNPVYRSASAVNYPLLHSGNIADYALSNNVGEGATITGTGYNPITMVSGSSNAYLTLKNKSGVVGRVGITSEADTLFYMNNDGTNRKVIHSGNVGSYALPIGGGTLNGELIVGNNRVVARHLDGYSDDGVNDLHLNYTNPNAQIYAYSGGTSGTILHTGNYTTYVTPANIGAAASDHTHTSIQSLGNYKFTASTLPKEFVHGLTLGFVNSDSGFGSYGTVITARGYSQGGGTLQLYAPYGSSYGGTHLKARFGDFGTNSGDSWTALKTIAWTEDIPSYGTSASALGTSSAGSATTVSRSDHVHALPALTSCTGTLTVAKGGTGATTAANARTNLGLGDAAVKGILNNTAAGALGFVSSTAQTLVPTIATIAFWNGAYSGTSSNLAYCKQGAFGAAATKGVDTTATSGSANLITSGAMYTALAGKANSAHSHTFGSMEFTPGASAGHGGFIDFHFNNDSADYTSRIAELTKGTLSVYGNMVGQANTNYTTNQFRNSVFTTTDPGAGVSTSYANGSIICVYE